MTVSRLRLRREFAGVLRLALYDRPLLLKD
jgi:hypothetical protein